MDARRLACLQAMGIELWVRRSPPPVPPPAAMPGPAAAEAAEPVAAPPAVPAPACGEADWEALQARVAACRQCPELVAHRTQTVFGVGDRQAAWMVVGEAPGADEDRQGEPFVGRAGQLLNAMLLAIGLQREQVYIANILKCRPPRNRDPRPEEAAACEGHLQQQIALVRPRVILALGRIAAQNLLRTDRPLSRMRGQLFRYGEQQVPVVVTYHPAYLLRSPGEKRKAWEDLQYAQRVAAGGGAHRQPMS